jgi:hypothetical protein
MFEPIVLGLILAGLYTITRTPVPRQQAETPTQPAPTLWSARTDWHRFHKPTYLRRGVVLDSGQVSSTPPTEKGCFRSGRTNPSANGETP